MNFQDSTPPGTPLDTVLVLEMDGEVIHRFCSEEQAASQIQSLAERDGINASMFTTKGLEAELVLNTSPNFRARVEDAKAKLRFERKVRLALDSNDVPKDQLLRGSILKAIRTILEDLPFKM